MSDPVSGTYRSREEVTERTEHDDPVKHLRDRLFQAGLLAQEDLEELDRDVRRIVEEAAEFADQAPPPDPEDLYAHVYATINESGRLFLDGRDV